MTKYSLQRQIQNIDCIVEEANFQEKQNINIQIDMYDNFFFEKLNQKKNTIKEKIKEINIILKNNCAHDLIEDEVEIPTDPDYPIIKKIIYCKYCELIF